MKYIHCITWYLYFPQMLGQFIARAIADHALPMSFLDCYKGKVDCDHARWAWCYFDSLILAYLLGYSPAFLCPDSELELRGSSRSVWRPILFKLRESQWELHSESEWELRWEFTTCHQPFANAVAGNLALSVSSYSERCLIGHCFCFVAKMFVEVAVCVSWK